MPDLYRFFSAIFSLVVLCAAGSGCGGDADGSGGNGAEVDPFSQEVEAFTGARTRMVWTVYTNPDPDQHDPFVNGRSHQLWGMDTADGRGPHAILKEKSSYGRPLISADGERILFTYKEFEKDGSWKRNWKPMVYAVDWDGTNIVKLAPGYATDVWRDPRTGIQWVYAARDFQDTDRAATWAKEIVRFQLDDPEKVELIWDQTVVSPDNFQVSGDGLRAASLFPWPDMGVIDMTKGEWTKYANGCWPSLAPDNSYLSWVFDGAHANLQMIKDGGKESWIVPINRSEFIRGRQVYHPRWSNHVRYYMFTGPYEQPKEGGNPITRGSRKSNVYIGKFNDRMDGEEATLRITSSSLPEYAPDLWIEGGEEAAVDMGRVGPEGGAQEMVVGANELSWPVDEEGLVFLWKDSGSTNEVGDDEGGKRRCMLDAVDGARYFRNLEMDCGGGYFSADEVSSQVVNDLVVSGRPMSLELQFTPAGDGTIIGGETFALRQVSGALEFVVTEPAPVPVSISMANIDPGYAHQVAIIFDGETWEMALDGEDRELEAAELVLEEREEGLRFGEGWDGKVKGVAVYDRAMNLEEVAAAHHFWETELVQRMPIPLLRVRGTLVEATAMPSVESLTEEPYRRALLVYTYEVDEILEGEFEDEKLLVKHWAILDEKPVAGFPRQVGEKYELILEPSSAHGQLKAERQFDDTSEFTLELFYDVSTPSF
ncbi:MAG: hypothetical protein AAGD22_11485 [Verrucomicrobiota bacterium]